MKQLFLLLPLTLVSVPVQAQQVNNFNVCTQNQEVYQPGGYDQYGNYIPGGVSVQTYNVPCNNSNREYTTPNQNYSNNGGIHCDPTKTLLGAILGGGVAASMSRGDGYSWSVPLGAFIGGAGLGCN
jgi:hypothetical protein